MHVAMVLLLAGYLTSYTMSSVYNSLTLSEGGQLNFPKSDLTMQLTSMEMVPYEGKRNTSFIGRYIDTRAHLRFTNKDTVVDKVLSVNSPVSHAGYTFFLQRFNPRQQGGMSGARYIIIDIRKDPGVKITFAGMAAFIAGFFGYMRFRNPLRSPRRTAP
jgi:ABC-type Fe3+-siderophore transport system permease subunit